MVLWKRESSGGSYIDLWALYEPRNFIDKANLISGLKMLEIGCGKNDITSTQLRHVGNEKFEEKLWHLAMEFYNRSLRLAIKGSENVGFAYANRSACFLKLKKYDQCLVDIELAKNSKYPPRLMSKLEKREAECRKQMKKLSDIEPIVRPVLSFPPNKNFPCMANVLEVQSNEEYGKHIVAKCDIEMGEIVMLEEGYVSDISSSDQIRCHTCKEPEKNFLPCLNCTDVMFCDHQCMESNEMHKMTCGASYYRLKGAQSVVESIVTAVTAFDTVDELMNFVERALCTRDFDSPECKSDAQINYRMFLKLLGLPKKTDPMLEILKVYQLVLSIPTIKRFFDSKDKEKFLMHLTFQHFLIIKRNGITVDYDLEGLYNPIEIMGNIFSFFNHSCLPNISHTEIGNELVALTILPVSKGEQLFINYMDKKQPTRERQLHLRNSFEFNCKCSKCVPRVEEGDFSKMQTDPDYQFIRMFYQTYRLEHKHRLILKEKSKKFLQKYIQFKWSEQIEYASVCFSNCMLKDFGLQFSI
ncbi:SET and MYND domain-containing protein DDB_G0273589-like [Contarinia nasturtii]|uniref:SET and MYND domain-containing protein DDB_G0273589-like n=1 Tax=Contarinia nasturtii TaxID=265458 RepID=UPI0012D4241C|nr:SET and MYND domain-containing protein DDB_G0273589-like [Contarinia nasturtii]